jgi:hypothetical protein
MTSKYSHIWDIEGAVEASVVTEGKRGRRGRGGGRGVEGERVRESGR